MNSRKICPIASNKGVSIGALGQTVFGPIVRVHVDGRTGLSYRFEPAQSRVELQPTCKISAGPHRRVGFEPYRIVVAL